MTVGSKYTWRGPKWEGRNRVFKRLDRILCNVDWRLKYHEGFAKVLPRVQSDHHPIVVLINGEQRQPGERPFRFIAAWTMHPDFDTLVAGTWENDSSLPHNLGELEPTLKQWNHEVFGNITKRKNKLIARLNGIQKSPRYGYSNFLEELEIDLQRQLATTLNQEESLWYQKSRGKWIEDGDRNTKYYHSKTIVRRRKNKIMALRNDDNVWEDDPTRLAQMIREYFTNLFCEDVQQRDPIVSWASYPFTLEDHHEDLDGPVTIDELKRALFNMGALKAPGDDGFPALFFQKHWNIISTTLHNFVEQIWLTPATIREVNNTLLVLIPKVDKPEFVTQFRPISLCNVVYKIVTKVIVNRIKPFLNAMISPHQSSFIPGRNIHHNIIIAQEMVHSMNRMKGKKAFMSIKIDLEKAYDRLSWEFIVQCLEECKFPSKLTSIIKQCVTSSSFQILCNGDKGHGFNPTRGIRQGDPLSPYLFVICMDRLSHIIADQVEANYWKPMKAGRQGPPISHLLFADDLLLFAEASIEQAHCIMHCLNQFCNASGQKMNNQKTQIFFSKNTDQELKNDILQHTGFAETGTIGRYLGANIVTGQATRGHYRHIIEKIQRQLSGWKQQCLSLAGRVTLTQSVISSIPYFHMQYANIPKTICSEVEKLQRGFVWGDTDVKKRPHLVNWETCCLPKKEGGLGLKRPRQMNVAFLMKILWNLITQPQDLWCQVLINKYGRGNQLLEHMPCQSNDSPLWKGIQSVWDKFLQNVTWNIGDGRTINFWLDKWMPGETASLMTISNTNLVMDTTLSLYDLTDGAGNWNLAAIDNYIPPTVASKVRSIPAPLEDDGPDSLGWRGDSKLAFSTKSAYAHLCTNQLRVEGDWELIWKWRGPHRIQTFIWLAVHGRLLTNARRHNWNNTISPICQACNQVEETQMHVLRDCVHATRNWLRLLPSSEVSKFFEAEGSDWVFQNLTANFNSYQGLTWIDTFMVTTWFLWTWRNKSIFEENYTRPYNEVEVICKFVAEISTNRSSHQATYRLDTTLVRWRQPEDGWIKLNSDGASRGEDNQAGCGGLLRDSTGKWVLGYTRKLGVCNAIHAEAWGMWIGVNLARQRGITKLIVESDSKSLVDMLHNKGENDRDVPTLIRRIRRLLACHWETKITHTWREGNSCADWLASHSLRSTNLDTIILEDPPEGITTLITDDMIGAPVPRNIRTLC